MLSGLNQAVKELDINLKFFLQRGEFPFVYPDLTERREGIESADSGRFECYKRFMCRAMAREAVGKTGGAAIL